MNTNEEGNYNRGQQVIAEGDDGIERRGEILRINNYTVTKPNDGKRDDGVNVIKQINEVRPLGGNTNIIPGNDVNYKNGRWKVGKLASINYLVSIDGEEHSIPHRRIRLAVEGEEQPREEQPTGIFTNGQQVQMDDGGLGSVLHLESYTIRRGDREHTRTPIQVRREGEILDDGPIFTRKNLLPGSRVEFQESNSWRNVLRGTIVSNNYLVSPVGEGPMRVIPGILLSLATAELQAATAQPQPATAQPRAATVQEDAFEIHNAFADLNFGKFMTIITRETNGASNFKNTKNILEPFLSYINSSDTTLTPEQKDRYTKNFEKHTYGIIARVNEFISDHPGVMEPTLEVIQFVLSQDQKYKDLFIETFENECMGAYSSGSKASCTKGMWERIYLANKGTIEGLCNDELTGNASSYASSSSYCKPVYLELYNAFIPGGDIDLNLIFMKWCEPFSSDEIPEEENPLKKLSVDQRKQNYRDFVKKDRAITQRIWNNKDFQNRLEKSINKNEKIFETLDPFTIGGRRSSRNKRSVRKINKKIKNSRSKQSVIKTIKKRKNKTIKKRR